MRDYKNIDRIFQENLKDFEVFPPNMSWDAIEKKLIAKPVKRRIPFWIKLSSIAALFVVLFSVGTIYLLPKIDFTKNFLIENTSIIKADKTDTITQKKAVNKSSNTTNYNSLNAENKSLVIEATSFNNSANSLEDEKEHKTANNKLQLNKFLISDSNKNPFNITEETKKTANKNSKFTVATIFAPIYINSFGDGSGVDSQFKNNPTSGNSSYSYGVKLAYQLNNKFTVQSGVNLINLGYTTNNIYINPSASVIGFSNLSAEPLVSRNAVSTSKNTAVNASNSNTGNLNQVFGYVEIPLELKYNITDGKFGVNLVGGFSTLLLNKDEVFIETSSFSQSLGSSNNLRSVNFSGNIGVDIDYLIHKNLYINVSPMFKMQTNTFSKNSGSIQPYYLGVYTGLNYKF
ncbi:hypothetical protein [Lutibacter sp.]|uniref:hypothetical protein n=1 Tax=Lutibacter sp. TaxID=1925666 RepID=UPI0035682715